MVHARGSSCYLVIRLRCGLQFLLEYWTATALGLFLHLVRCCYALVDRGDKLICQASPLAGDDMDFTLRVRHSLDVFTAMGA